jgi:phosphodiesterase/alkaline phosphatase D-like protein
MKGMTVKPIERTARTASMSKTGPFATLRSLLPGQGIGAPTTTRRLALLALPALVLASFALTATPALAALPKIGLEYIELQPKPSENVRFTGAVSGEVSECDYQYGITSLSVHVENEAPCGDEANSLIVHGLTPGTAYHWRVVARNASGEAKGEEQLYATVPATHTEAVKSITATTATFAGELTSLNETVPAEYFFQYNFGEEPSCNNERRTEPTASAGTGSGVADVSTAVTGLESDQQYTVCLVSRNEFLGPKFLEPDEEEEVEQREEDTTPIHFKTPPGPPKVESESESNVTPYDATLEGQVNPENEATTYDLEYATEAAKLGTAEATTLAYGFAVPGTNSDQPVGPVDLGGNLTPETTYYYRVVAENAQSRAENKSADGGVKSFTTAVAKAPEELADSGKLVMKEVEGQLRVSLEAQLNPNNQETGYDFQYAASEKGLEESPENANHEFNTRGEYEFVEPLKGSGYQVAKALLNELTSKTTYYYRIIAENETTQTTGTGEPYKGPIQKFEWLPPQLGTAAGAPTVTQYTASVPVPMITPEVLAPVHASYYLLYGPSEPGEFTSPMLSAGSGTNPNTLAPVQLTGLQPGTTYHYEVAASSAIGQVTGPPQTFTTAPGEVSTAPPEVGPQSARFVNETSAVIEGELNPEGLATTYEVQYGTTASYGSNAQAAAAMGPFTSAQDTLVALAGLTSGTTYHYRLVATNGAGTDGGPDETFTTAGAPQPSAFTSFAVPSVPLIAVIPYTFPTEPPIKPVTKPKSKPAKCKRGFTKKKNKCVRSKSNKKAKRSSNNRRGK